MTIMQTSEMGKTRAKFRDRPLNSLYLDKTAGLPLSTYYSFPYNIQMGQRTTTTDFAEDIFNIRDLTSECVC